MNNFMNSSSVGLLITDAGGSHRSIAISGVSLCVSLHDNSKMNDLKHSCFVCTICIIRLMSIYNVIYVENSKSGLVQVQVY